MAPLFLANQELASALTHWEHRRLCKNASHTGVVVTALDPGVAVGVHFWPHLAAFAQCAI